MSAYTIHRTEYAPAPMPVAPGERAIDKYECARLWGVAPYTFMQRIAAQPGFPERVNRRPAAWIAREVLAWREANRASPRGRQRTSGSSASAKYAIRRVTNATQ